MKKDPMSPLFEKGMRRGRWLYFPLSILIHALMLGSIVVVPWLSADGNLPDARTIGIQMITPPPIPNPGIPVVKPRILKKVKPVYPQPALRVRVEGMIIIEAWTDIFGQPCPEDSHRNRVSYLTTPGRLFTMESKCRPKKL